MSEREEINGREKYYARGFKRFKKEGGTGIEMKVFKRKKAGEKRLFEM